MDICILNLFWISKHLQLCMIVLTPCIRAVHMCMEQAGRMLMLGLKGPLCPQHKGENHLTEMQPGKIVFSSCLMLPNTLNWCAAGSGCLSVLCLLFSYFQDCFLSHCLTKVRVKHNINYVCLIPMGCSVYEVQIETQYYVRVFMRNLCTKIYLVCVSRNSYNPVVMQQEKRADSHWLLI